MQEKYSRRLLSISAMCGYYIYKGVWWNPSVGEVVCCELKERNTHDPFAVAQKKAGTGTVGHQQPEIKILYHLVSTSCCQTISTSEVITVLMSSVQKLFCCTEKLIDNKMKDEIIKMMKLLR